MTYRLLINPGSPQAWEIQLQPGANRIGRNEANDFIISHESVSGDHCEITLSDVGIFLKDLGSTNGTFVNRVPVTETKLQPGQHVQLGQVDMAFEASNAAPNPPPPPSMPVPISGPPPSRIRLPAVGSPTPGVRLARAVAEAPAPAEPEIEEAADTSPAPAMPTEDAGKSVCKSHPKTPARFRCGHCQKYFCDLCVTTRGLEKYCRTCGQACTPLRVAAVRPAAAKSFYARLPGAFVYPFRGIGLLILVCATIAFLALEFVSAGIFSILAKMVVYGFVFLFMQNIIHTTTADENEPLSFPEASGLFGAFFALLGTILAAFGLAIGLLVAKTFFEVEIPLPAIVGAVVLGCLYFPMAFLAVAMKDSVLAANPMLVVPTILRMPLEYLVASVVLMGVFGVRVAGGLLSGWAGSVSLSTRDMSVLLMALGGQAVWGFISVYLLTVSMRILGLLYLAKKDRFGWFSH